MARHGEPIRKLTLADGTIRWRAVVDTGTSRAGRRAQLTRTFSTQKEARAFVATTRVSVAESTYVQPSELTVADFIDQWLDARVHVVRPKTVEGYRSALGRAKRAFGDVRLDQLSKRDIVDMVDEMRGGEKALSPRSVNLTLGLLRQALNSAVRDGVLSRNPAMLVERLYQPTTEMDSWSAVEASAFLAATADHLWAGPFALSLSGLRRGEVLGIRWADVDLDGDEPLVVVRRSRVQLGRVGGGVSEGEPKSFRSRRLVPLAPFAVEALKSTRDRQADNRATAEGAYDESDFVCANELGQPPRPETYSTTFHRLAAEAGLRRVRLHDLRHTSVTLMLGAGIPVHVVAAVHGHDPVITQRIYAHTHTTEAMKAMAALDDLIRPAPR